MVSKKIHKKVLSNGEPEYLPVYDQKTKKDRVEIGRISLAPYNSSKATIVVNSCGNCTSPSYDPVNANHGRELASLDTIRDRKNREIAEQHDKEEGGEEYYSAQTVVKLRQLCRTRGLKTDGKKQELIDQLIDNDENPNL